MRTVLIVALLVVFAVHDAVAGQRVTQHDAVSSIDYVVRRLPGGDRHEITLRFVGDRSGTTMLRIPGERAGAQRAERGVEVLVVRTPGATLEDTKRIVHKPRAPLDVRYLLRQIAGLPAAQRLANIWPNSDYG